MVATCGTTDQLSRRMLKKARLLTRPTLARRDAPSPKQGRSRRTGRRRTLPHPPHPELPRQLVSRVGYVEDLFKARTKLEGFFSILPVLMLTGCASSPYERGGNPQGLTQRDVERDYMECEYKARLANPQHFYNQSSPFPFSGGPQNPSDHAHALHGLSTINAMRDTCLAAKGYRVE